MQHATGGAERGADGLADRCQLGGGNGHAHLGEAHGHHHSLVGSMDHLWFDIGRRRDRCPQPAHRLDNPGQRRLFLLGERGGLIGLGQQRLVFRL